MRLRPTTMAVLVLLVKVKFRSVINTSGAVICCCQVFVYYSAFSSVHRAPVLPCYVASLVYAFWRPAVFAAPRQFERIVGLRLVLLSTGAIR